MVEEFGIEQPPVMLERQGDCCLCGQCCGAEGSPSQASPWPRNWPSALRNWQYEDILQMWPQAILFGLIKKELPDENVGPVKLAGYTFLHGRKFHWIYIKSGGVCKDLPPYGGPPYSLECPLLDSKPGGETRPCALFGTDFEWMWRRACQPHPPIRSDEKVIGEWHKAHPLCSYTWEAV